jgi:hypothetical protein
MSRLVLVVVVALLTSIGAVAAPVCGGSQNVLSAGFTCEFDGLLFSNFSVVNAGNVPNPSMNLVSANSSGGYVNLNFNPSLAAQSGAVDVWFYFTVTGGINGIDLTVAGINGSINDFACATPFVSNVCESGDLASMIVFSGNSQAESFPNDVFQSPVYIYKNILVQGPGELSSFTQSFHIPEPISFVLIGSGLLALGLLRRKVKN